MKKSLLFTLLPLATLLLGVAGCDEGYSDLVVYEVRTDPLLIADESILPEDPDRPGQLPMMKIADLNNPLNPFYDANKTKDFVESEIFRDPTLVSPQDKKQIKDCLDELFGTPANPRAGNDKYVNMKKEERELLKLSEGPDGMLVKGSKLYRIQCLHCHGVTGDGRGPTARWVNPHPRDYRQGLFKFHSLDTPQAPPHREDLLRTLELGIEGTAMPSFGLLAQEEREALVSYVIHLSLRGGTEFDLFKGSFKYKKTEKVLAYDDPDYGTIRKSVAAKFRSNVEQWVNSQAPESQIQIGAYPAKMGDAEFKESVKRGKQLFTTPPVEFGVKESCVSCHIDYGRRSTFRLDKWGTLAKPNNLIQGVFRGGRRPIDVYRRIHSGIYPSGMIAFKDFFGDKGANQLKVAEYTSKYGCNPIWDLVNFVQVVGNPTMRKNMEIYVD